MTKIVSGQKRACRKWVAGVHRRVVKIAEIGLTACKNIKNLTWHGSGFIGTRRVHVWIQNLGIHLNPKSFTRLSASCKPPTKGRRTI